MLNACLLPLLAAMFALVGGSLVFPQIAPARRFLLHLCTVFITLNLLLYVFDEHFISVRDSLLPTAVYSVSVGNQVIFLNQPTALSPFGFKTARKEPKIPSGKRILFLGNSMVHGTGSTFATNYPQATEEALNAQLGVDNVTIFSAGVDGYGVAEERVLYDYLVQQGYHFDAVLVNFSMGADPTNDIEGTIRSAIVGEPQRVQQNLFVRYFSPLNSTLFRFLVYLKVSSRANLVNESEKTGLAEPCRPDPPSLSFARERDEFYYGPGAQQRIRMVYPIRELDKLAADVQGNGSEFGIILLPDKNALLASYRDSFPGIPMDWTWTREFIKKHERDVLLDLSDDFREKAELFRCTDTHWNDAGNLYAAQLVSNRLARYLQNQDRRSVQAVLK